jgi:hypothetical protein
MAYLTPPLKTIATALEEEDFAAKFFPSSEDRPLDMLLVSLSEPGGEPCLVEMTFPQDLLYASGQEESIEDAFTLQFLLRYRFSFDDALTADVALLLHRLNRLVPVGAFGMSEDVGTIFLQYALILPSREADADVLATILSSFETFAPMLAPLIEEVGSGRRTIESVIESLEDEEGIVIPPMLPGPASLLVP